MWAELDGLTADARSRLERLNPPRYLANLASCIEEHVRRAPSLPRRWDAVEVGSNRGNFCIGLARAKPGRSILALEWRDKWARCVQAKAAELNLVGLHCLCADARIALPLLAPSGSVGALFVLFPDPWWKRRHAHRRLLDRAFLEVASELLAPNGLLVIKTDVRRVRDEVAADGSELASLVRLDPGSWPDERRWPLTNRERACLRHGTPTYRLFWRRVAEPAQRAPKSWW